MNIEQLYQLFLQHPDICTDTRRIIPNALFFALKGDNFDGNEFASLALENGCSYAIVDNPTVKKNDRYIIVDDILKTLQRLANHHRRQLGIPILAITGTNGKTTTKELIGSVLTRKYEIGITIGNLNNHIGVPLTLLKMTRNTAFGIVEMGANHIGEIAGLCAIAEPDYGIITNIGKAHLEGFGSLDGVKKAKGELYDYLEKNNGLAFVNTDDSTLQTMVNNRKLLKTHPYSATLFYVRLLNPDIEHPFLHFVINRNIKIETSLLGEYNLNNILVAISIGLFLGVDINQITDAICSYHPENNRSQLIQTQNNTVYMDAYNANPSSMEASICNFAQINEADKLLILGDMLELGCDSLPEHQHVINQLITFDFKNVWLVGNNFIKASQSQTYVQYPCFKTVDEAIDYIKTAPVKKHTILLKGSRGIHLEKALEYL
ncbi:MAG: UDP-N-acetylmuramoyl-tripeptide--D-alanyl-D-alanine ligase [Prevotellaceae bacterium]|nr:UDP-N-acetylmuramoyl-tripeptide--D-alanyl-D-alanine ligase [Prevotellaceae bacterium]